MLAGAAGEWKSPVTSSPDRATTESRTSEPYGPIPRVLRRYSGELRLTHPKRCMAAPAARRLSMETCLPVAEFHQADAQRLALELERAPEGFDQPPSDHGAKIL